MAELPMHSMLPFKEAIEAALKSRAGDSPWAGIRKKEFYNAVAARGPWAPDTIASYCKGTRNPVPEAMEIMSDLLKLPAGAAYFREFRQWQILAALDMHPEVIDRLYVLIQQTLEDHQEDMPRTLREA